ncbi:MAG: type II secretion system protein D, partial [Acidiferrobacter sp.]
DPGRSPTAPLIINFNNADIHQVLDLLLRKVLGYTYVVSPNVTGRVNLQASAPLDKTQVRHLVNLIMAMNHLRLVRRDQLWVVERALPAVPGTPSRFGPRYRLEILSLGNVPAAAMETALRPLLTPNIALRVGPGGRTLLLYGINRRVVALTQAARHILAHYAQGLIFRLVRPRFIPIRTLLPELLTIRKAQHTLGERFLPGAVPLPLPNQRALLVVAANRASLHQMLHWIAVLDTPGSTRGGGDIHLYNVRNGDAATIAAVLGHLLHIPIAQVATTAPQTMPLSALGASMGAAGTLGGASSGTGLALPGSLTSTTSAAAHAQQTVLPGERTRSAHRVAIVADEANNTLVIRAPESVYLELRAILVRLDIPARQVLIQAMIADVTLNKSLQYGIEYFFRNQGAAFHNGPYTGVGVVNSTIGTLTNPPALGLAAGLSYGIFGPAGGLRGLFQALASRTHVHILSTPQILCTSNHTAAIQVGDQVPVPVASLTTTAPSSTGLATANTIQYQSTGVLLGVTPRVDADGRVTMKIYEEVSSVQGATTVANIEAPTFATRTAQTTFTVKNGSTAVIGGLISTTTNHNRVGVPLLMDIPILGDLFSTVDTTHQKEELLLLITPHVVASPNALTRLSVRLRQQMALLKRLIGHPGRLPSIQAPSPSVTKKPVPAGGTPPAHTSRALARPH